MYTGEFPGEGSPAMAGLSSEEGNDGLELSLGLSLNGRFGVDPMKSQRAILRSSSVANMRFPMAVNDAVLHRTCSLPAESDEEWRRRKDCQTLRRMEAKRKRAEKQKMTWEAVRERCAASGEDCLRAKSSSGSPAAERESAPEDDVGTKDMPRVATRGLGPDARRVEGFLYQYRKGKEVKIMCVCHGHFHSPTEFVRHAGGGDVAHPLRHIVVDPNPFL